MKLLREFVSYEEMEILCEDLSSGEKVYRIKGPYLQAEVKNKNGREYPRTLLEREVVKMQEKIAAKRSMGELDHPASPTVNLDRVSHLIESLSMEGNTGVGVSKVLPTPMGKIAQTLLREGIVLGVSTRGVGTLKGTTVNDDYRLITVDIVADPSAPGAFVQGILENKEFMVTDGGDIVEKAYVNLETSLDKNARSSEILGYITKFFESIRSK
jgi:hypothetical protein